MMAAKTILFISYDAKRAGSAMLLLNLCKAIKEVTPCNIDFLFRHGGEMLDDFRKVGSVNCINQAARNTVSKLFNKLVNITAATTKKMLSKRYDCVIVNTVLNADIIKLIRRYHTNKIACYIHELNVVIEFLNSPSSLSSLFNLTDILIAPCEAVKHQLFRTYKISEKKIRILPYYIPVKEEPVQLNLNGKFMVGGCGTIELRKGTDVFVQLAKHFCEKYPGIPAEFLWIGGNHDALDYKLLAADIAKTGLQNIRFLPPAKDMGPFYAWLDVFVLTSREDPYPLVVLEAADACVPSICFDNAGGASEFVNGNGKVVRYLDIEAMAGEIHSYYNDQSSLQQDGMKAKSKLRALHQDKAKIVAEFFKAIE